MAWTQTVCFFFFLLFLLFLLNLNNSSCCICHNTIICRISNLSCDNIICLLLMHPYSYRYANTFDLNVKDAVVHKHIPYIIILINIAEEWANSHGGNLPSTRQEKRDFKVVLEIFYCSLPLRALLIKPFYYLLGSSKRPHA